MTIDTVLQLEKSSWRRTRFDTTAGLSLILRSGEFQILPATPGSDAAFLIPLITGEEKLVFGSGTLLGYPLQKMSSRRRRQLLQQTGILPHQDFVLEGITLGDFLTFPLRISGMTGSQIGSRVRKALIENELLLQTHQPMYTLTPTQVRLAALAQALIKSPRLVIAELRSDDFDRQVTTQILQKYASHGGAVLAIVDGAFTTPTASTENSIGSEIHAKL